MKSEIGRQIKSARAQVIEFKRPENFLQQTKEEIFYRWLHRDQSELALADAYAVRRTTIERVIHGEVKRRIGGPVANLRRAA